MTDAPLLVIIPSRSRPEAVKRVVDAWYDTGGFQVADMLWAIDVDDPRFRDYQHEIVMHGGTQRSNPRWVPMVTKLNSAALDHARYYGHRAIAFMGDDHLPRSHGWAHDMLAALDFMGTGIVYPNDGYQGENLASCWAMTSDIIRALGRMVPAPVEHLYCDNAVMDIGRAVGRLRYLPEVLVEHMHPVAGKAETDEQYDRVNGRGQYARDRAAYKRWRSQILSADAVVINELLKGATPDV